MQLVTLKIGQRIESIWRQVVPFVIVTRDAEVGGQGRDGCSRLIHDRAAEGVDVLIHDLQEFEPLATIAKYSSTEHRYRACLLGAVRR